VKKIFLILLIFLLTSFTNTVDTIVHKDWTLENAGEWASFYWKVDRSKTTYNGTYWYYVYFYSNSFFATTKQQSGSYDKAITYIKNAKVVMYEYKDGRMYNSVMVDLPVVLCDYEINGYGAWFSSYSKANTFMLGYEQVTAYDYSDK